MIVNVVLFAAAKDLVGQSAVKLDLPQVSPTIQELKVELARKYPQLEDLVNRSAISLQHEFATEGQVIADGDEIALIPPVSGG